MEKKKISRSIFFKLIIIIVLYGVLMNIAVALFFKYSVEFKQKKFNRNFFTRMDEYIINDIGNPPDTVKARTISDELNISLRYKYQNTDWSTSLEVPTLEELSKTEEFNERYKGETTFTLRYKDKICGIHKTPNGIFILSQVMPQDTYNPEKAVVALLVLLSIIFIPLYFLLRWLFNPLKSLTDAVIQIGKGNYNVDLPINKKDEFGELARSLKEMSSKVKNFIRAKEQLLIDVSHELRTPLTRIRFGLELNTPKEKINEDLMEIENMLKKILEYYRNEYYYLQVNLKETEIVPLIENLILSFDLRKNRIEFLNYVKNKERVILNTDREKLMIAFRNLISNALKFSPEDKNVIISLTESEKHYEVSIKDFGEGINEEEIYKIFEPFSRIDSSRSKKTGGYGLGLAIVKKIVDLHNATIEVKSKKDEGTEMIIKFNR
jgi:signal transduction histidine kinase